MARGTRKPREVKTTEQKLEAVTIKISETEELLKTLRVEQKELKDKLNQEKVDKLLSVIAENGMTIDDATGYIEQLKSDETKTA